MWMKIWEYIVNCCIDLDYLQYMNDVFQVIFQEESFGLYVFKLDCMKQFLFCQLQVNVSVCVNVLLIYVVCFQVFSIRLFNKS